MRQLICCVLVSCGLGCGVRNQKMEPVAESPTRPHVDAEQAAASPPAQLVRVESPLYTSWAGFKKGSVVVHSLITEVQGVEAKTTTLTTSTLVESSDERVVVEVQSTTKHFEGAEVVNPPQRLENPRWITPPSAKTGLAVEGRDEATTLNGKKYQSTYYQNKDRNEAGEVFVETWTSTEVPGGLLKSITSTPAIGKKTTTELTKMSVP